jgi:predicted lipoprotein
VALLAAVVVYCAVDPPWVTVSLGAQSAGSAVAGSSNLNPDRYVASIWASKVLPTVRKSAVDLPQLLAALKKNRAAASARYGHHAVEDGPPSFLVKGSGSVVSVDTTSLVSTAGIAFSGSGKPDAYLQLGPILGGTDVRDALPFINFNDFENQVQYGEVAISINSKIVDTAYKNVDYAKLKGKKVTFAGAFTLSSDPVPTVTPVTLEVGR